MSDLTGSIGDAHELRPHILNNDLQKFGELFLVSIHQQVDVLTYSCFDSVHWRGSVASLCWCQGSILIGQQLMKLFHPGI